MGSVLTAGPVGEVAAAIVTGARERRLEVPSAEKFQSVTGQGIVGEVKGHQVAAGTAGFLAGRGVETSSLLLQADFLRQKGQTVVLAAIDGKVAGLIAVADPIKSSAREAVESLKRSGLRLVMLTGDNRATAEAIAKELVLLNSKPKYCRKRNLRSSRDFRAKDASSPWPETASMTRRK